MTGSPRFGIETVREAVRRRVEEKNLRDVADEIPMSFSGLRSFLNGGTPHPATMQKLATWYVSSRGRIGISKADRDAAVSVLVSYMCDAPSSVEKKRRRAMIIDQIDRGLTD